MKQINLQQKYIHLIEHSFDQFKIFKSRYLEDEPIGIEGILTLAREVYKDTSIEDLLNPAHRELLNPEEPTIPPIADSNKPENEDLF